MSKGKINPLVAVAGAILSADGQSTDESWHLLIEEEALGLASQIEYAFHKRMSAARKKLPIPSPANLEFQINIFVDAMLATTCGLLGKYVNISAEFEDAICEGVRAKFSALRKMHIENKGPQL